MDTAGAGRELLARKAGPRAGAPYTFVSSRTRFCSRRARASCISRFFLSSSSWLLSWRTSSWSCSLAFSSPRALQEAKGQSDEAWPPGQHPVTAPRPSAAHVTQVPK